MTVLHFNDGTDEILTSSWTARPSHRGTEIAFLWGASVTSFFQGATGLYRINMDIPFVEFMRLISQGGIVDLMKYKSRES